MGVTVACEFKALQKCKGFIDSKMPRIDSKVPCRYMYMYSSSHDDEFE